MEEQRHRNGLFKNVQINDIGKWFACEHAIVISSREKKNCTALFFLFLIFQCSIIHTEFIFIWIYFNASSMHSSDKSGYRDSLE